MAKSRDCVEEYVEKYAQTYRITPEEAKTHLLVKLVKEMYEEDSRQKHTL